MSALVDRLVAQVLGVQVRLLACQAPSRCPDRLPRPCMICAPRCALAACCSPARRVARSRATGGGRGGCRRVDHAAAHLASAGGLSAGTGAYKRPSGAFGKWPRPSPEVADSPQLAQLLMVLDAFAFSPCRPAPGVAQGLARAYRKTPGQELVEDPRQGPARSGHDRHRLRLLIKRVRYAIEAYPELDRLPAAAMARLKAAQSALGDWHDCWQWLARVEHEPDLLPCVAVWQQTA